MPVADFPGGRNWGYDGVLLFAPDSAYGRPEDMKAFVDAAHGLGLMVFLDVVYNHLGPEGNFLPLYAPLFNDRHQTPWGAAINFDGEAATGSASWFSRMRSTGCRSTTSTGCASMPSTASSTTAPRRS